MIPYQTKRKKILSFVKFFQKNFFVLVLFFAWLVLVIKNFPFGTWYTGWDNLHPEFNFALNIKRAIFSVWQENQGLGTYGGHGYAATLPHTLFLFFFSFFLPQKYLRSSFTSFVLICGALGVFYLVKKILSSHHLRDGRTDSSEVTVSKDMAALLASLFYLLNFGTIQNFYIPLEAFIVHFAALPWLFYTLLNFLEKGSKKNLTLFSIVTLLSTPQGFIPPLFLVYFLFLFIFLFFYLLEKISLERIKESVLIIFLTLAINAYWFLPVAYYAFSKSHIYLNAYNNLTSTEDFILKNKKYGNLKDIVFLRGFLSETIDISEEGKIFPIFAPWNDHFGKKGVVYLGFIYFLIILIGAVGLFFKKTKWLHLAFLWALIISFSYLATNVPPFSLISRIFQSIPIFKQAFRASFTKFSISLSFFYALFFGTGMYIILISFKKITKVRITSYIFFLLAASSLIYLSLPAFAGNLLYQRTKINIPKIYFELFDFFKKQDKKERIANFPQGWHWGWSIYKWGYSGSGFLWYGIEQPIMDRAFDVWGRENENYHWEVVYSLYSQNFPLFEKILEKYQINWLILDKNIIPYQNARGFLFVDKFEDYLQQSDKLTLEKIFSSSEPNVQEIKVYKVNLNTKPKESVAFLDLDKLKNIGPQYNFSDFDQAFLEEGDYYTNEKEKLDLYYPFRSLFTGRKQEELELKIEDQEQYISFKKTLPLDSEGYILKIPPMIKEEFLEIDSKDLSKKQYKFPEIYLGEESIFSPQSEEELKESEIKIPRLLKRDLEVRIPKIKGYFSYNSQSDANFLNHGAVDCDLSKEGVFKQEVLGNTLLRFTSLDSENCYDIILSYLPQRYSYLIKIQGKHLKGKALQFAVVNHESKKADLEVSLPKIEKLTTSYLILPPMKSFGQGYSLHFNNVSIGKGETINDLKNITLTPIAFNFLKNLKFIKPITKTESRKQLLIYSQSFDPGWAAFYFEDLKPVFLKKHVLVNNWANGWLIEKSKVPAPEQVRYGAGVSQKLKVVYLPQYLQYLGFVILLVTFLFFLKPKKRHP